MDSGTGDGAAEIYSAVLRRLVTQDSSFERGFIERLVVVDHFMPLGPEGARSPSEAIPHSVKSAIATTAGMPPLEFVRDEDGARYALGAPRTAVVRLGPLRRASGRVAIDASLYVGDLGATSMTYLLERGDEGWRITGRTGGAVA